MRTVALYLGLVGIPVLGLVTIVNLGERIVAPYAIDGTWTLESVHDPSDLRCPALAFLAASTSLRVSQSGVRSVLTFDDPGRTAFHAVLRDTSLVGVPAPSREPATCHGLALRLEVVTSPTDRPVRLQGVVEASRLCGECPSVVLHLVPEAAVGP